MLKIRKDFNALHRGFACAEWADVMRRGWGQVFGYQGLL